MKKSTTFVFAVLMILSLVACGNSTYKVSGSLVVDIAEQKNIVNNREDYKISDYLDQAYSFETINKMTVEGGQVTQATKISYYLSSNVSDFKLIGTMKAEYKLDGEKDTTESSLHIDGTKVKEEGQFARLIEKHLGYPEIDNLELSEAEYQNVILPTLVKLIAGDNHVMHLGDLLASGKVEAGRNVADIYTELNMLKVYTDDNKHSIVLEYGLNELALLLPETNITENVLDLFEFSSGNVKATSIIIDGVVVHVDTIFKFESKPNGAKMTQTIVIKTGIKMPSMPNLD